MGFVCWMEGLRVGRGDDILRYEKFKFLGWGRGKGRGG